ncbi:hypothetical protein PC113_g17470 [Phytophthora cactorum]|uniref:Uncharacterized protein n=1 Tax=Phytophthora cactorum TaxID=29920 RepID=A0A8T0YM11_9STRA|nr:hypothetical protein PC111_g16140 [Phytophthora cactorum]KAG2849001.1 hypothetical protein PC113_g17470 [Phytophthora cactorum]KAG3145222.1 hypothetical protein C6341_g18470 [Phytophthora cactorum]KAG3164978.1 hypothetical protein PC128_g20017 [Phytophthora cactorum]
MVKGSATPSDGSPVTAGVASRGAGLGRSMEHRHVNGGDYEEKAEDAELGDVETTAELLSEVVELTLQVGRMGPHVDKSAGNENDEEEHGVARGYRPPLIPKATRNANSPSANKVLAQLGEEMR